MQEDSASLLVLDACARHHLRGNVPCRRVRTVRLAPPLAHLAGKTGRRTRRITCDVLHQLRVLRMLERLLRNFVIGAQSFEPRAAMLGTFSSKETILEGDSVVGMAATTWMRERSMTTSSGDWKTQR